MRFELHYRNGIKKFDTLEQVKHFTRHIQQSYVVYKFVESKMHESIEEYEIFGDKGAEGMMRELARGISLQVLVAKYHTTYHTLTKHIHRFNKNHKPLK